MNGSVVVDASLALAEDVDCKLWTADERFYRSTDQSIRNVRWIGEFVVPE